jgi:hypothetical protein
VGEAHDPGDGEEQQDAHAHRGEQAGAPRLALLIDRQLARQDGDEDDVVDAQHHLQEGECEQGNQAIGGEERMHSGIM